MADQCLHRSAFFFSASGTNWQRQAPAARSISEMVVRRPRETRRGLSLSIAVAVLCGPSDR